MINGTKPATSLPKRQFHRSFGGVAINQIPDFNLDAGLWMPDQDVDGAPTECTGYAVTDIKTDFDKQLYSPDWQYAKTLQLENVGPTTTGADFHVAMQSAVVFGSIKKAQATLTALSQGEIYTADINNWPFALNALAAPNAEIGTYNALGNGDCFDSIASAAYTNKMGVSIGSPWYREWAVPDANGIVMSPANVNDTTILPWHNWVIKGLKTINNTQYLIGKSWQGTKYGWGGFHLISRATINSVMTVSGTGAISFADSGNRFINLCLIFLRQQPALLPYLSEIMRANQLLPQAQVINQRTLK